MAKKGSAGVVAAGHEDTAQAAAVMLEAGGTAFDAALSALCAACVAEPVLASLGGGGFLLAQPAGGAPVLYDFFVQTPRRRRPVAEVDFRPIVADFGDAQQEFHIGLGAAATPGLTRGLFAMHRDLCRLPLARIVEPACALARQGVPLNPLQGYIATVVEPILRATPEAYALHRSPLDPARLAAEGEAVPNPALADAFEALAREGEDLFYRGEMGRQLVRDCRDQGGHLGRLDLESYRLERRAPLDLAYRDARIVTNPPPSLGGLLIGLCLRRMATTAAPAWGEAAHLSWIAGAMRHVQALRRDSGVHERVHGLDAGQVLLDRLLRDHAPASRGTTQISALDRAGNLASLTLSNGEGCGYVLPGTGIMLNNMLGEEDLNPHGFHAWPADRRMASMMAPTALRLGDGSLVATGSGGSNRIRSAILQVISNLVDFRMGLDDAVTAPRIHFEDGLLNLEPPQAPDILAALRDGFPEQRVWNGINLFFGGAHSVIRHRNGSLEGAGDPRRGGVCRRVG